MVEKISPQVQEQIVQYQNIQQQIQITTTQKLQIMAKVKELEMGLKELDKAAGKKIYKSIGMLLVEVDNKDALKKELEELKESYDLRVKTLERQEKRLSERFQVLHEQLSKAFGTPKAPEES